MIIPVRCFTCGKVIGNKWKTFQRDLREGKTPKETLDRIQLDRYCCRRMFVTHVELIDNILVYSKTQQSSLK